jgi:membrane protein
VELADRIPAPLRSRLDHLRTLPPVRSLEALFLEIVADDVPGLAAEMAYRFVFALFPFLIFLAALVGFVSARVGRENLFETVMGFLGQFTPAEINGILAGWVAEVVNAQSGGLLTLGALGALWGAMGGVGTLIKGLNRAYDVQENRPFWQSQLLTAATTLGMTLMTLIGAVIYSAGAGLGDRLERWLRLDPGFSDFWALVYPVGFGLALVVLLVALFALLPNVPVHPRHAVPGAIFATLAWTAVTVGFGLYVSHFGNFARTFGTLGAAAVLMFWMYVISMILLVGGEINALLGGYKRRPIGESAPANPSAPQEAPAHLAGEGAGRATT